MAWDGVLGMIDVVAAPPERETRRRARERADAIELQLDALASVHRDATPTIDWRELAAMPPPLLPAVDQSRSTEAWHRLQAYRPDPLTLVDRRQALQADIERLVAAEEAERAAGMDGWRVQMRAWSAWCSLSARMLCGDVHAYREAIAASGCLGELLEVLGEDAIALELSHHDAAALLTIETTKIAALRAAAPQRCEAVLRAYAAAAPLRLARELLAVLPIERVSVEATVLGHHSLDGHSHVVVLERGAAAVIDWLAADPIETIERTQAAGFARRALE